MCQTHFQAQKRAVMPILQIQKQTQKSIELNLLSRQLNSSLELFDCKAQSHCVFYQEKKYVTTFFLLKLHNNFQLKKLSLTTEDNEGWGEEESLHHIQKSKYICHWPMSVLPIVTLQHRVSDKVHTGFSQSL